MFNGPLTRVRRGGSSDPPVQEMRPHEGLFHDDAFRKCDAGHGTELRVTTLDELAESHRGQSRGDSVRLRRLELRHVTGEGTALRFVVLADVYDERRHRHVVDEVIA